MAKQLKDFNGHIEAVKPPRFAEDRKVWVLMVKENGRWTAVVSKDEQRIRDHYQLIESKRIAQSINTTIQSTSLSASKVRLAEYAYSLLERHSNDEELLLKAVELFSQRQHQLQSPLVSDCVDKFMLKQRKRNLSAATLKDYHFILKEIKETYEGKRIREVTPMMWTRFIEAKPHPVTQRARFIYLKSFLNFCVGKNNPEATENPWLETLPLYWEPPKTEVAEIASYTYSDVVELLKRANQNGTLGFHVMRLFSMMRTEEYERFIEIGGKTVKTNRYIDLENGRITINNLIYKKRGQSEHRGRYYTELPTAFKEWLEYFNENDTDLSITMKTTAKMRRKSPNPKDRISNILRHSAITFHSIHFSDPLRTSYIAGNSVSIISDHYLNMNIPKADAEAFYELTPTKAKDLGII